MLRAILLTLVAVLAAAAPAAASAPAQEKDAEAELRARWEKLDPERRAALRERYERLRSMTPEERERALALARRMRQESEATLRSLDPADRDAIAALDPAERSRVLRSLVADRARIMATRLRAHLTDEERAQLKDADAAERARILQRVRSRAMDELPRKARRMGEALGLSPQELERFSSADPKERRAGMVALARRRATQFVRKNGLPEGVTQEDWDRVSALPDGAFVRALQRLRARHPEFGVPPRRMERARRRRSELASQLMSLGTPSTRERAGAPGAREGALRRGAVLRHRAKIEDALARRLQLPVEVMAKVRTLDDDGFVALHRQLVRTLSGDDEPRRAIERWFDGRAAGQRGRGPGSRGRGPGGRDAGGRDAGGRDAGGRDAGGRRPGGRESSGRQSSGRQSSGRRSSGRQSGGRRRDG